MNENSLINNALSSLKRFARDLNGLVITLHSPLSIDRDSCAMVRPAAPRD